MIFIDRVNSSVVSPLEKEVDVLGFSCFVFFLVWLVSVDDNLNPQGRLIRAWNVVRVNSKTQAYSGRLNSNSRCACDPHHVLFYGLRICDFAKCYAIESSIGQKSQINVGNWKIFKSGLRSSVIRFPFRAQKTLKYELRKL